MASNRDLAARATALAAELKDETVTTEGLNNGQLTELVASLEARVAAAAPAEGSGGPPEAAAAPPPPAAAAPTKFLVAPGKSLTTGAHVRGPGEELRARDLPGGADQLEALASKGYLVKS